MNDRLAGQVFDLHFAGGALGQDAVGVGFFNNFFKRPADSVAEVAVFLLHSRSAGQTAASAVEVFDGDAQRCEKQEGIFCAVERFEMAGGVIINPVASFDSAQGGKDKR